MSEWANRSGLKPFKSILPVTQETRNQLLQNNHKHKVLFHTSIRRERLKQINPFIPSALNRTSCWSGWALRGLGPLGGSAPCPVARRGGAHRGQLVKDGREYGWGVRVMKYPQWGALMVSLTRRHTSPWFCTPGHEMNSTNEVPR